MNLQSPDQLYINTIVDSMDWKRTREATPFAPQINAGLLKEDGARVSAFLLVMRCAFWFIITHTSNVEKMVLIISA
jgi:hypothetical protein